MTDNNAEPNASKKDYKKLVNRLRCPKRVGANREACTGCEFLIEYGVSGVCICDPAKIDKQAADAIEELQTHLGEQIELQTKEQGVLLDRIVELEQQIPKHGEWIWDNNGMDWGIGAWKCKNCHSKPNTYWECDRDINPLRFSGSHYCPNCGAKMGVQDADN